MDVKILTKDDYTIMPWKNGKGCTEEMGIFPPLTSVQEENFLWRLSSAQITEEGPFSFFRGYYRHLFIIEGEGIELQIDSQKQKIFRHQDILFSGDQSVYARLLNGPVTDLNFIFKAGAFHVKFCHFTDSFLLEPKEGSQALIYTVSGKIQISNIGQDLNKGDTAWIKWDLQSVSRKLDVRPQAKSSCILIQLDPK